MMQVKSNTHTRREEERERDYTLSLSPLKYPATGNNMVFSYVFHFANTVIQIHMMTTLTQ